MPDSRNGTRGGWTRRDFLRTGALAGGALWAGAAGCAEPRGRAAVEPAETPARRPNFVFLLCDDLGYGDLGCYGHPDIRSPNLDRLASEGMRLSACYAPAPVCSPARAGFLTGRVPMREGIADWIPEGSPIHLRREAVTIARLLKGAGYATCMAGKWHLSGRMDGTQPTPGDHGFDHWLATQNNAAPSHRNPVNFVRNGQAVGPLEGYSSALIVDEAIRWLEARTPDQPFFLYVPFHSPHEPVATDDGFVRMYAGADAPNRAAYCGNVSQMDAEVGRLVKAVDAAGFGRHTLVFFTSDNGPETLNRYKGAARSYGWPGAMRGMKLHLYEGGIRVPGILRWTGTVPGGQPVGDPVSGVDVLPTFAALAGVRAPTDRAIDGASLVPLLNGRRVERTRPLYWDYPRALGGPKAAMRDGDWKILSAPPFKTFELYNLRDDPSERRDVAAAEPERVRALGRALVRLHGDVRA